MTEASRRVLDDPLSHMMICLAASRRRSTGMPLGQAVPLGLQRNMPRTAEEVLAEVKAHA